MRRLPWLPCLALALSGSAGAGAAILDTERLAAYCLSEQDLPLTFCLAYATGVWDGLDGVQLDAGDAAGAPPAPPARAFCAPANLRPEDLREAFVAWLRAHPGALGRPSGEALRAAYLAAWPCPR